MSEEEPEEIVHVNLHDIDIFPHQSRELFDDKELANLAEDIKRRGLLQPGVAWLDPGRSRHILVCGERRFRALKLAGMATMAVKVIRGPMTQSQLLEINIAENIQRASLNPIERARSFRRMMQLEGITAHDVAARLKISDATVSRDLSLLDLSPLLQQQVAAGELPSSVASTIARMSDEETRRFLADQFASGALTRDGVTAQVNQRLKGSRLAAKVERLACRVEGVAISVSGRKLTLETLVKAIDQLRRKAKELPEGSNLAELARSLKAL